MGQVGNDIFIAARDAYKFVSATDQWVALSPKPTNREYFPMLVSHSGDFVCVGGQSPYSYKVEVYNLYTDEWRSAAIAPLAQSAVGSCSDGRNFGYTVGGIGGPSNNAVQRYSFTGDLWTLLADAPTHRWSLQVALVDTTILAVGGQPAPSNPSTASTDVYAYTIPSDTWAAKNPIPSLSTLVNALVGRSTQFFVVNQNNDFHSFTLATNTWTTLATAPNHNQGPGVLMPSGHFVICLHATATTSCDRYDTSLVETNPWTHFDAVPALAPFVTYQMGQFENDFFIAADDLAHLFKSAQDEWVTINPMPTHRYHLPIFVSSTGVYVLVGGAPSTNVVEGYNVNTDQWATLQSAPLSQAGGGCSDGSHGYTVGGTFAPTYAAVQRYTFATDAWTFLTDMPTGRSMTRAGLADGLIVCVGANPPPAQLNEVYTIATDTWATKAAIPTTATGVNLALGRSGQFFVITQASDFYKYTVATDAWVALETPPVQHLAAPGVLLPSGVLVVCTSFPITSMCSQYNTGLASTVPAVAASDPHMRGFYGHLFLLECEPGTVVNLFSSSTLQVNALLDRPLNAPHAWRVVISRLAVKVRVGAKVLSMFVESSGKVFTNVKPFATHHVGETVHFSYGDVLLSAGTGVRVTTHLYSIQALPQRLPDSANDYFRYLDVLVNPSQWKPDTVHGILGQTIRPNILWPRSSFIHEVKDPFEYLEGTLADYVVESGLLGDPLRFNLFDPFGASSVCALRGQQKGESSGEGE